MSTHDQVQLKDLEKLANQLLDPNTSKKEENKAKKKLESMDPGLTALRELNPELAGKVEKRLAPRQPGGIAAPQPVQAAAPLGPAAGLGMGGPSASGATGISAAPSAPAPSGGGASPSGSGGANQAAPMAASDAAPAIGGAGQVTALEARKQVRSGTHKRNAANQGVQSQDRRAHRREMDQAALLLKRLGDTSQIPVPVGGNMAPGVGPSAGIGGSRKAMAMTSAEKCFEVKQVLDKNSNALASRGIEGGQNPSSEAAAESQAVMNPLPDSPEVRPESPAKDVTNTPSPAPGRSSGS